MSVDETLVVELAIKKYSKKSLDHAFRVASYAKEMSIDEDWTKEYSEVFFLIGLLHDIIEDTDLTLDQLKKFFTSKTKYSLEWIETIIEAVDTLTQKEGESYDDYMSRIFEVNDPVALLVKKADFKDHFAQSKTLTVKLLKKYAPYVPKFM